LIAGLSIGIALTLFLLAKTHEAKARKSVALAILRTETVRQLQEIWASPSPSFTIKSETLFALAGKEPARLLPGEKRFTIGLLADGNPLDRILGAAPLLDRVEQSMASLGQVRARLDLRLYKKQAQAVAGLSAGEVDFMQMNAREYLSAKAQDPGIQPLVRPVPGSGGGAGHGESAVIFTRADTGIHTLSELGGKSFLFGTAESTFTFWAKVYLVEAGVRASDLAHWRYLDVPQDLSRNAGVNGLASTPRDLGNPFSDMTPFAAVLDKTFDAAVATERRFLQVAAREKLVLLKTFQDAGPLLVSRSKMPAPAAASFKEALLRLKDPQVLRSFPGYPSRFEACADSDFTEMRNHLRAESIFHEDSMPNQGPPSKAGPAFR
jgi:ABC-type phosphate/phosphonate transport system substrate-binding protein